MARGSGDPARLNAAASARPLQERPTIVAGFLASRGQRHHLSSALFVAGRRPVEARVYQRNSEQCRRRSDADCDMASAALADTKSQADESFQRRYSAAERLMAS